MTSNINPKFPRPSNDNCPACSTKADSYTICCDSCAKNYHYDCEGLSKVQFMGICGLDSNKGFYYFCNICKLFFEMEKIKMRMEENQKYVDNVETNIKEKMEKVKEKKETLSKAEIKREEKLLESAKAKLKTQIEMTEVLEEKINNTIPREEKDIRTLSISDDEIDVPSLDEEDEDKEDLSADEHPPQFDTVELLSLYATMVMKRLVHSLLKNKSSVIEGVERLLTVVEYNLSKMRFNRKWFFATLRDHARLHHSEWRYMVDDLDMGQMTYNSVMLIVALRLGLEKLWPTDGNLPLLPDSIRDYFKAISNEDGRKFALTHLNQHQAIPHFEFFAQNSPNLYNVQLPMSDNDIFKKCIAYKNLREIELAGGVTDKVMCNALWNTGTKKSDKVLELALKDGGKNLTVNLPHLTMLRSNMLMTQAQSSAMRLSLGAAALIIQPEMETVKNVLLWDTYDAIVHLLEVQRKLGLQPSANHAELLKSKSENGTSKNEVSVKDQELIVPKISSRPDGLDVKSITVRYRENLDTECVLNVIQACPKINRLALTQTQYIQQHLPLLCKIIPMQQLTTLVLDAFKLTGAELYLLLTETENCKHVTLRVTPSSIASYCLPSISQLTTTNLSEEEAKIMMSFPHVETLVLDFIATDEHEDKLDGVSHPHSNPAYRTESLLDFLSFFTNVEELFLRSTVRLSPHYLVYGCIAGALAQHNKPSHLSVIAFTEDIIDLDPDSSCPDSPLDHCNKVKRMFASASVQDILDINIMKELKSLELDSVYVNDGVDLLIKSLRVAGVLVSIVHRPAFNRCTRLSDLVKGSSKLKIPKFTT